MYVIRTIIAIPKNKASTSLIDCLGAVSSRSSGITDTVAMYIKPPAVNGRIQAVAAVPTPSASKPQTVPAMAPIAVRS